VRTVPGPGGDAVAVGHVGHAIENAVPAEQVLRGTGGDEKVRHGQGGARSVQSGADGAARGRGAGAAVHIVAGRVQRPVRGPGGDIAHRVRDRALPEPDGRAELRGRRLAARVRGAQAERRPQAQHESLGGVHHRVRVPVRPQDTLAVPDAGRAGVRQVRVPGRGQDDRRHQRGAVAHPRTVRRADHAVIQVRGHMAPVVRPLAHAAHPVAASQPGGRGEDRGLRPAVQGQRDHARQTELDGGRRVGHVVHGRREPAAVRRLPETVPERAQDAPGPSPGPARQPHNQLSRQDAAAVRVRETPVGRGMGRTVLGRPHQRHTAPVDIVPAVPSVSALLFTARGPVQGQDAKQPGERGQTDVEADPRVTDQFQSFRQTVTRRNTVWFLYYVSLSCIYAFFYIIHIIMSLQYSLLHYIFIHCAFLLGHVKELLTFITHGRV